MHRCYPGKCRDGFHYSSTSPKSFEEQIHKHFLNIKKVSDEYFAKDLPRPDNYEIIDYEEIGDYLILTMHYPNCSNWSGRKILVVKASVKDLIKAKHIDPHFAHEVSGIPNSLPSPIARFEPTPTGLKHAQIFVHAITGQTL